MEWLILAVFCLALLLCIAGGVSILYALGGGLLLFCLYGRRKGFSWSRLCRLALEGVRTVKNILLTFVLIGILTALWRSSGTIAWIVSLSSGVIRPSVFLLMAFLLNCGVSVLTGTSFGTAATMGVICVTIGNAIGFPIAMTGGAVLSGIFFGDRCSPVSTSALLVAETTGTDLYANIRRMLRSAAPAFLLGCILYIFLGIRIGAEGMVPDLRALFEREYVLHWAEWIPALAVLVLSACKVKVRPVMCVSILLSIVLCVTLQGRSLTDVAVTALRGYQAVDPQAGGMMNGGGILSMLKVSGIVCLSSSYSGIFRETGLLDGAKKAIEHLAARNGNYTAALLTSVLTGMIACNQTLTILLTRQLCQDVYTNTSDLALDLEDTAVITSPMIPWSIAGSVPLAAIGAGPGAIPFGFYLILLPVCRLLYDMKKRKGTESTNILEQRSGSSRSDS